MLGSGPPRSSASSESAETGPAPGEAEAAPPGPPKPRANPFGAARPREEVLKEQGRDAVREESQRRAIDRCARCPFGVLRGWVVMWKLWRSNVQGARQIFLCPKCCVEGVVPGVPCDALRN